MLRPCPGRCQPFASSSSSAARALPASGSLQPRTQQAAIRGVDNRCCSRRADHPHRPAVSAQPTEQQPHDAARMSAQKPALQGHITSSPATAATSRRALLAASAAALLTPSPGGSAAAAVAAPPGRQLLPGMQIVPPALAPLNLGDLQRQIDRAWDAVGRCCSDLDKYQVPLWDAFHRS